MKPRDFAHASARLQLPRRCFCSRRSTAIGIFGGVRLTPRSSLQCPAANLSITRRSTQRARSPSTRRSRTSGRGSSRSAFGKAGFYSYDLSDNAGSPSANRILPEHQHPTIGDWVPMAARVNDTTAFKIVALEPHRFLVWGKPHSSWVWTLKPLRGGRTRLVTRLKDRYSWRADPLNALLSLILFEFGDFAMMRRLLFGVKWRAERIQALSSSCESARLASSSIRSSRV
jgi:hypothetical protein